MNIIRTAAIALSLLATPALADPGDNYDRHITVTNSSNYEAYNLYFAVPGREFYDVDLLGDYTLRPNQRIRVNISDGTGRCVFTLKAVTRSGQTQWTQTMNVCAESGWTLNN